MNGSDFRGKTVGPVLFETACTCNFVEIIVSLQSLALKDFKHKNKSLDLTIYKKYEKRNYKKGTSWGVYIGEFRSNLCLGKYFGVI